MTVEVLAVGTELLLGQIANTNAQYISSQLPKIGANVYHHSVVGDNMGRLKAALSLAMSRADFVVVTGGLGPTTDDVTKQAVAELLGLRMLLDGESMRRMRERMARLGRRVVTKNNERQAWFPEGATALPNDNGTAPGCIVACGGAGGGFDRGEGEGGGAGSGAGAGCGKAIIMLPGPPSEMRPMFDGQVMPFLARFSEWRLESRFVRVFGVGESELEDILLDLIEGQANPTLALYAKEGEVAVRVTARYPAKGGHEDVVAPVVAEIKRRVGHCAYSSDGKELAEAALDALIARRLTLALAESCTGGLASARITAIPGASEALLMSAVAYSDEAKRTLLGVRAQTLREHGAVSAETAAEMAAGARRAAGSDIAVSITGIAGPGGGSEEKPVGLVYLAIADGDGVRVKELRTVGPRERVRGVACLHAFDMARRSALGLPWAT